MPDTPQWPLPPNVDDDGKFIIDNHFLPDENLYVRVQADQIIVSPNEEPILAPTAILFPDFSVNREKYSKPEDVIKGYEHFGIAAFEVQDVPARVDGENGSFREFKVEHDPVEEPPNYAHSEVRTYHNNTHSRKMKVPTTIKSVCRQMIADKAKIVKRPPA